MIFRFGDNARRLMERANAAVRQQGKGCLDTGDLLLALLEDEADSTYRLLVQCEIDPQALRRELQAEASASRSEPPAARLPQEPDVKRVIEFSIEEARILGDDFVGTEHLVLGFLRQREGRAGKALLGRGLILEALREEILKGR